MLLNDFRKFTESFKKHFEDSNIVTTAQNKLDELYQTGSAAQYIARFNEWVVYLNLTDASKIHMLYCHLKASIKDAVAFTLKSTHSMKFKEYCELITGIDDCLHKHKLEKKRNGRLKDTRVDLSGSDSEVSEHSTLNHSHIHTHLSTSTTTSFFSTDSTSSW
uniref:Retrotransposon gag domain-containing protein n=1 Tax=Moniliophthora roreri TaxID=221103 RepID=A0A0W0G7F4_MONRR